MESLLDIESLGGKIYQLADTMEEDAKFDWTAFNPSIIKHNGKTLVTFRSSNYTLLTDGTYKLLDYGGIRNRLWVAELADDMTLVNKRLLDQEHLDMRRGMEDARIRHDANGKIQIYAIGVEPWIPKARVIECNVNDDVTRIETVNVLPGLTSDAIEKNWVAPSGIHANFDYWHSPGIVYTNGEFRNVDNKCEIKEKLRGSTPFIKYGKELLSIMHVTQKGYLAPAYNPVTFSWQRKEVREYQHHFVTINLDGEITRVSKPFRFKLKGVEFAAGIVKEGDNYLVTHGAGDRVARLAVIPCRAVDELLVQ